MCCLKNTYYTKKHDKKKINKREINKVRSNINESTPNNIYISISLDKRRMELRSEVSLNHTFRGTTPVKTPIHIQLALLFDVIVGWYSSTLEENKCHEYQLGCCPRRALKS